MESRKPKAGQRERRSRMRLSDVQRMVDKVLPKHMPEDGRTRAPQQGERRGGTFRKP